MANGRCMYIRKATVHALITKHRVTEKYSQHRPLVFLLITYNNIKSMQIRLSFHEAMNT